MIQPPQLIGLSGYAGSGKDTVREHLQNLGYIGFAFADPIRGMLRELLTSNGIDSGYMDDRALKEAVIPVLGVSYRHMAQTLGTEWGRSLQDDFWLRLSGAYMADMQDDGETQFVISDVRFLNEAQWIRDRGGVIWYVERSSAVPVRPHVSESEIGRLTCDRLLHNNGTLDELAGEVARALNFEFHPQAGNPIAISVGVSHA